jgi:GNAT superfamily N-acetyltransferase
VRYLIDTNILIALEPTSPADLEPQASAAARVIRRLTEGGHRVLIHPASRLDLERDRETTRKATRAVLLEKYSQLDSPPPVSVLPLALLHDPTEQGRVDNAILAAVVGDAVDFAITEDRGLHSKARMAGVSDRVLSIADALEAISALMSADGRVHPAVAELPLHAVLDTDPIWRGFTDDYPDFPRWLATCKRQGRQALVVRFLASDQTVALCILKDGDDEPGLGGRVVKLCTFKVADEFRGHKQGELLLKAIFEYTHQNHYDHAWITVFPRHADLTALLETFGFSAVGALVNGELVYAKTFGDSVPVVCDDTTGDGCLATHVAFGPPSLHLRPGHTFVIPVQPRYHRRLFPEAELETELSFETDAVGNALRKAYLCNSSTRQIEPGDALLFYRSQALRGIYAVGVAERVVVSDDPDELIRTVGQRTVYSQEEIQNLAKTPVLAILFRQDRLLSTPITLAELIAASALGGPPQQITHLRRGATPWLCSRLHDGSH